MAVGALLILLFALGGEKGPADSSGKPAVRILTGFDYSPRKPVERIAEDHFSLDFGGRFCNWFMFKVEGAKGRAQGQRI